MPLIRYFFFAGAALLALLFFSDAMLPKVPTDDSRVAAVDLPLIRIQSDRKWPDRVVFDTNQPTIVPTPAPGTLASAAPAGGVAPATEVADVSAKARVREAFAQFTPAEQQKKPGSKLRKPRAARNRAGPPTLLVAQQPRMGFFGNTIW